MLLQVILEGLGLGALLFLVCAVGIRKGAVGMVHLYSPAVQRRCVKLGLTTREKIKQNALIFKAVCVPGYIAYVLVCVYGINGARSFAAGFWQLLVILSVMNLMDRLLVDGYWVGHTNAWTIPGTEDLKPYITAKDKQKKWLFGTVGMAVIAAALARIMMFLMDNFGDFNDVSNLLLQDSSCGAVLSCYGCDGGEQRTGCKLFTGSVFLHFTYLHRVLQRAEICQQGGRGSSGGRIPEIAGGGTP